MVVFDNSIFCLTLHPDAKPRSTVTRAGDRIQYLIDSLRDQGEVIIIPAPVLSEFLVFTGSDAPEYLAKIRESPTLRVESFDERAAIELADMEISARTRGNKRGSAITSQWQKVKFDRQVVAIARVHRASVIYSDDPDIAAHGKDCNVTVLSLAELSLPPAVQADMFQELPIEPEQPEGKGEAEISKEGNGEGKGGQKSSEAKAVVSPVPVTGDDLPPAQPPAKTTPPENQGGLNVAMKYEPGETSKFLAWLNANPSGFVVNKVGGQILALHAAGCEYLRVENIKGDKYCDTNKNSIILWCRSEFGRDPKPCGHCSP